MKWSSVGTDIFVQVLEYVVMSEQRKIKRLEWTLIGKNSWKKCTSPWFNFCKKNNIKYETRIVFELIGNDY